MDARVPFEMCQQYCAQHSPHLKAWFFLFHCFFKGEDPDSLVFDPPPLPDGSRINLPVLIMASSRPNYLFRMLQSLRRVVGLNAAMVTVFIDGFFEEPALLAGLYKLKVDQHEGVSQRNARIAQVQCKKSSHHEIETSLKIGSGSSLTNWILKHQCSQRILISFNLGNTR